jgi:hypothetical protein
MTRQDTNNSVHEAMSKLRQDVHMKLPRDGLAALPSAERTPEICLMAVKSDWRELRHVPGRLRSMEICEVAVRQHCDAFHDVPVSRRTREICEIVLRQDGLLLKFVKLRSSKIPMPCVWFLYGYAMITFAN